LFSQEILAKRPIRRRCPPPCDTTGWSPQYNTELFMSEISLSKQTALQLGSMFSACPIEKLGGAQFNLLDTRASVKQEDLRLVLDIWKDGVFPQALKQWALKVLTDPNIDKYKGAFSVIGTLARPFNYVLTHQGGAYKGELNPAALGNFVKRVQGFLEEAQAVTNRLGGLISNLEDSPGKRFLASMLHDPLGQSEPPQQMSAAEIGIGRLIRHHLSVLRTSTTRESTFRTSETTPQPCEAYLAPVETLLLRLLCRCCLLRRRARSGLARHFLCSDSMLASVPVGRLEDLSTLGATVTSSHTKLPQ